MMTFDGYVFRFTYKYRFRPHPLSCCGCGLKQTVSCRSPRAFVYCTKAHLVSMVSMDLRTFWRMVSDSGAEPAAEAAVCWPSSLTT